MGYYSDVNFVTTPAGHELLQTNKEKLGFAELLTEFNNSGSFEIEFGDWRKPPFYSYSWTFIKWSEYYPEIGSFVDFVHSDEFVEPFIFTRFGEYYEDIEREERGDTEELPFVDIKQWVEFC